MTSVTGRACTTPAFIPSTVPGTCATRWEPDDTLCRLVAHHSLAVIEAAERGMYDELTWEFALREHCAQQAKERLTAGLLWKDHGLVFASQAGTPLDASHVRRAFKAITRKAGLGENWTPRELRHSFVSIRS
jgi:Phage integrase family